jgi:hypothetical protein
MSEGGPKFSDEESALILQRAAELQAKEGRSLSLRELEVAAAEAGIDVALVRRAAHEVAVAGPPPPPPPPATGGALGSPLHVVHERTVPGEGSGRWDDELAEIRRQLGIEGRIEATARQLVWTAKGSRDVRVTVVARGGRRIVRVEERLGGLGGGLFLGMGVPVTFAGLGFILPICIAVLHAPVLIPVAFLAWGALTFLLARTLFAAVARPRNAELRALADGLADVSHQAPLELRAGDDG